ncbi:unnamed protein product [Tetraodon nigroviridis]|uniref:(spotted green pufferfish) hypothetical protein n=1 Tax=Tetraodon nigroviridis TaxID=99883 RepID=Q4TIW3_TETNG|nr:unnamed protein product [Tetraodon nigroviridis]
MNLHTSVVKLDHHPQITGRSPSGLTGISLLHQESPLVVTLMLERRRDKGGTCRRF